MVKKLIIKLGIFSLICLGIVTFILVNYGGYIDYFYEKFTTPDAESLIIGDSRSFQGVQPAVMDEFFEGKQYDTPFFNYSFTIAQSVIGPLYNQSILRKLDKSADNGIYVICISPEMLAQHEDYNNAIGEFREAGQPPHNMKFVSINPNYEYLVKNFSFFHFKTLFRKKARVHKNGWLEETNLPTEDKIFEEWKEAQINIFLKDVDKYELSQTRIQSLSDLVTELDKYGHVFLTRMPISKEFLKYEDKYFPRFNRIIDSIANLKEVRYFDFNNGKRVYKTYDGHHVDKFSGKEFTKVLCDSILQSIDRNKIIKNSIE
ncbi:hypothetical protein [Aquimarina sp. AU474]|uniref:hypothetical protein n=1 Tax=Aquimarina sp. AU474 TaxID=2108529 RepID=UPI001357D851|nr:hypothetical protein [Aquimarina sp. AU474]